MLKRMRFTPHTHTHTLLMLMSVLAQLLTWSFICHHYCRCCELFIRLESLEHVSPANPKSHFHICTHTAKSWHRTYWDGRQLLFISVELNWFRRWLRALRTWTLRARCLNSTLNYVKYLIRGCSVSSTLPSCTSGSYVHDGRVLPSCTSGSMWD